ncbi:hypothetical protein T439DRAFT_62427 [Meredithblackwellia eburnea MCA 4105]
MNNQRPRSDSFDPGAFIVPINTSGHSSSSSLALPLSSPTHPSFQSASSTRNYRHSALVEAGDYIHIPPPSPTYPHHQQRSSFEFGVGSQLVGAGSGPGGQGVNNMPQTTLMMGGIAPQGQKQQIGLGLGAQLPQHHLHQQQQQQSRHVARIPSIGQLSSSSSSGGGSTARGDSSGTRNRPESSNRMVYSPISSQPAPELHSPSWPRAGVSDPSSSYFTNNSAATQPPPTSSIQPPPPPPQSGTMRRGMSYDGAFASLQNHPSSGAVGAPPLPNSSLLPTSYATGARQQPTSSSSSTYGGASPNSLMSGVQRTSDYNPGASPTPSNRAPLGSPSHGRTSSSRPLMSLPRAPRTPKELLLPLQRLLSTPTTSPP